MAKCNIRGNDGSAAIEEIADSALQPQAALQIGVPVAQVFRLIESQWPSLISDNVAHGSVAQLSPQRAERTDDDDYFLRNRDSVDTFTDLHLPLKFPRLASVVPKKCNLIFKERDLFNEMPDDLLLHVFRYVPRARDRASFASVCKRWLKLQSHMRRKDFYIKNRQVEQHRLRKGRTDKKKIHVDNDRRVERQPLWAMGDISRCLEGNTATDVRLAAVALGTADRGGLSGLYVKGGGHGVVSDEGLLAIGHSCAALQNLVLWDCPMVTNKSIIVIGKRCRLLRMFQVVKCPLIGDSGVSSVAKHAFLLSTLTLDRCPLIGDAALHAVSKGSQGLMNLNIKCCPLVGDDGLRAVLQKCRKLQHLKLQGLRMSDGLLMWISRHCKALSTFGLRSLDCITEAGFLSFCKVGSVKGLKSLAIAKCPSFDDNALVAVGNSFQTLKQISLSRVRISDQGLMDLVQTASSLEILHVKRCKHISSDGLISAISSAAGRLKEVHIKSCEGVQEDNIPKPSPSSARDTSVIRSICLADCDGVGDGCLSLVGSLCNQQLRDLNFSGLTQITDAGVLILLEWCQFVDLNITGCEKLTDLAVIAIAKKCGKLLKRFVLDKCTNVTDAGLKAIGKYCVALEELHISECSITDAGLQAVISGIGSLLISLNFSGCGGVTNQVFSVIEKGCPNLEDLNLKGSSSSTQWSMRMSMSPDQWMCKS